VVNCLITPWLSVFIILQLANGGANFFVTWQLSTDTDTVQGILLLLVMANLLMPFILTSLHGLKQLYWMFISGVQFYMFLPTMVGYFGAYAFSRTWDLSWGNRPSDTLTSIVQDKSKKEHDEIKARIKNASRFICWAIFMCNVVLVLLLSVLRMDPYALLVVACCVFCWSLLQMFLSFFFLLYLFVFKRIPHYLNRFLFCKFTSDDYLDFLYHTDPADLQRFMENEGLVSRSNANCAKCIQPDAEQPPDAEIVNQQ